MAFVYVVVHIASGTQYVGKTSMPVEQRWYEHRKHARHGKRRRSRFVNALRKHGPDAFRWICRLELPTDEAALAIEMLLIKWLKEHGVSLYNMTDGGEGTAGFKHSEETKAKIAAALKGRVMPKEERLKRTRAYGRVHTQEAKERIAAALKGKAMSEETKAKLRGRQSSEDAKAAVSMAMKGKPKSAEHRKKISDAQRGRKRGPYRKAI